MSSAKPKSQLGGLVGILIFAGFCGLAAWIWVPGAPATVAQTRQTPDTVSTTVADGIAQLAALIPVTTERPLFHATRKPKQAPEPVAAPAAPERTLSLVGILGDDGAQIALVRISGSSELYRVEAGGNVEQWQVLFIGENFVQVSKDDGDPFLLSIGE